jgi:cytochrome c556
MRKCTKFAAALIGLGLIATATAGDDPLEDAIKARRGFMQVVVFNAGPLFAMAKGKIDYNADVATIYANNLKAAAMMSNGAMWPEGSANEFYSGVTRALPVIWEKAAEFNDANEAWKTAVLEMAEEAGAGLDALRSKIGAVGEGCKNCHDNFRAEDF